MIQKSGLFMLSQRSLRLHNPAVLLTPCQAPRPALLFQHTSCILPLHSSIEFNDSFLLVILPDLFFSQIDSSLLLFRRLTSSAIRSSKLLAFLFSKLIEHLSGKFKSLLEINTAGVFSR